jgi:hypothetical protein
VQKIFVICFSILFIFLVTNHSNAVKSETVIKFKPLKTTEVKLVNAILQEDYAVKHYINLHEIDFPQAVHIAKADLDGDGKEEILLLIKRNNEASWDAEECLFQMWKQSNEKWQMIGFYKMREEPLRLLDETHNGFHQLANKEGIIPWYEWKKGSKIKFHSTTKREEPLVHELLLKAEPHLKDYFDSDAFDIENVKIAYINFSNNKTGLILFVDTDCGTAGCNIYLFKSNGENWQEAGKSQGFLPAVKLSKTHDGYPEIYINEDILKWNSSVD